MYEDKPSLLKQLFGAGVGMMVALGLYMGYTATAPTVQPYFQAQLAYLFPPGTTAENPPSGEARMAEKHFDKDKLIRISARAREISDRLSARVPADDVSVPHPSPLAQEIELPAEPEPPASVIEENRQQRIERVTEETLVPDEEPTVDASNDQREEITSSHAGAPNLPDSGVTLWMATLLAFLLALIFMPKVREWMYREIVDL